MQGRRRELEDRRIYNLQQPSWSSEAESKPLPKQPDVSRTPPSTLLLYRNRRRLRSCAVPLMLLLLVGANLLPWKQLSTVDLPPPFSRSKGSPPPPSCLLVYHIPKTGGTSVQVYLRIVAQKLQWEYRDLDVWATRNPGVLPPPHVVVPPTHDAHYRGAVHEGHITPNYEYLTHTQECAKLTVLREPVDRVVSAFFEHHHHTRTRQPNELLRSCLRGTAGADDPCLLDFEYRNDVTRRFSNRGLWWNSYERAKYLRDGDVLLRHQDDDSLLRAQRRLLTFTGVCFLSFLPGCMERFVRETFGLEVPFGENLVLNEGSGNKTHVTDELRREIADANSLDIRLYEWALETFRDKIRP